MARTADTATTYKVKIHTNNGYRYASTQPLIVDPERSSGILVFFPIALEIFYISSIIYMRIYGILRGITCFLERW